MCVDGCNSAWTHSEILQYSRLTFLVSNGTKPTMRGRSRDQKGTGLTSRLPCSDLHYDHEIDWAPYCYSILWATSHRYPDPYAAYKSTLASAIVPDHSYMGRLFKAESVRGGKSCAIRDIITAQFRDRKGLRKATTSSWCWQGIVYMAAPCPTTVVLCPLSPWPGFH